MEMVDTSEWRHRLPDLPYPHAALEPHIDTRTMRLHHEKHHAAYIASLNAALNDFPELHKRNAHWLLLNLGVVPQKIRNAVRNNAGGHVNHSFLWRAMSPSGNGAPAGALAAAIDRDFGSFDRFKLQFAEAGKALSGSGWVWLVWTEQYGGTLQVYATSGHDNPLMLGDFPILVNDLWEHAYYLKYENRRGEYLDSWWAVVNWDEAARRFDLSTGFISPSERRHAS